MLFCPPGLDLRPEMMLNRYPVINVAGVKMVSLIKRTLDLTRNPYDLSNREYYEKRRVEFTAEMMDTQSHQLKLFKKQKGFCPKCAGPIEENDKLEVHHKVPLKDGGKNTVKNLQLIHYECHKHIHSNKGK